MWHGRGMPDFTLFGDAHVRQYEATGGKVGRDWNDIQSLILHTTGRKSGRVRKFALNDTYQAGTTRDIPVVLLTPRNAS